MTDREAILAAYKNTDGALLRVRTAIAVCDLLADQLANPAAELAVEGLAHELAGVAIVLADTAGAIYRLDCQGAITPTAGSEQ